MIKFYRSPSEMLAEADRLGAFNESRYRGRNDWFGGTLEQMRAHAACGDTKLVPDAEALIAQISSQIESSRHSWEPAPAGAFPCVPDAIRGVPSAMRRRVELREEHAPLAIIASTTSSASITADQLAKRGAAILALCMALATTRPLALYALATTAGGEASGLPDDRSGETVLVCEINTHPLDLASACWQLTSANFGRRLCYALAWRLNGFLGGWPRAYTKLGSQRYHAELVTRLGFDPRRTLMVEAIHASDPMLRDPVAWINEQIKRFAAEEEAAGDD